MQSKNSFTIYGEKWLPVYGYEGYYEISNYGRLKSVERRVGHKICGLKRVREKLLPAGIDGYGYPQKCLFKNGIGKTFKIHKLVMRAFVGEANGMTVNHKNGIKTDNRLENLEYCSMRDNILHAHKTGLRDYENENNPNNKFSNGDIIEIRRMRSSGEKRKDILKRFGLSGTHYYRITKEPA